MGRANYAVLDADTHMVLANISGGLAPGAATSGRTVDEIVAQGLLVDPRDLALLLAASLDLYRAATAAYQELHRSHGGRHRVVRALASAIGLAHGIETNQRKR
jgi:hypothetical protein